MTNHTIFISHTTADDKTINRIADTLENAGHTVWVDHRKGIIPGTPSWDKEIRMAIKNADIGVFVMTEKSLESDICGAECILIRELNKPLYVLRLEICKPENIFLYIKQIQYADLTKNFDEGIASFLESLGGKKSDTLPTATRAKLTGGETMRAYLPFLANPLRGRDADITHIQLMLTQTGITQIIGGGGLGKSRLSAEIALAYPNGAVWHRCSSVSSVVDLLYVLRRHFDLPDDIPQENILTLLDTHRPLIVIDNAEDVAPKSDRRAGYVELLNKIAGFGVPILLTTRTIWREFRNSKSYKPPHLNKSIAEEITSDFAKSLSISLSPDQISELTQVAHNHPYLIEIVVRLLVKSIIPYKIVIQYLNDVSYDDMQEALNEIILKTINKMRVDATDGENAYLLLKNLTFLQATFPFSAIQALKPDDFSDEKQLIKAINTLGEYVFLDYDYSTERYRLGTLVKEALGLTNDEKIFNRYSDFYTQRAKEIFVNLKEKTEFWKDYNDDITNIIWLGNELVQRTQNGKLGNIKIASIFANYTREYVYLYPELKLFSWVEMGLNATHILRAEDPQNATLINIHANLSMVLGAIYLRGDKQIALPYFDESLDLYKKLGDIKGIARALTNIGSYHINLGDYPMAKSYYDIVISLQNIEQYPYDFANTLGNLGSLYFTLHQYKEALDYYNRAFAIFEKLNDKKGRMTTLHGIGNIWFMQENYENAQDIYYESLFLAYDLNDKNGQAQALGNLANIFMKIKDFKTAEMFYNMILPIWKAIGNKGAEAATLHNFSIMYYQQNLLDKAIEYQEHAILATFEGDPNLHQWQQELTQLKAQRDGGA